MIIVDYMSKFSFHLIVCFNIYILISIYPKVREEMAEKECFPQKELFTLILNPFVLFPMQAFSTP